MINNAENYQHSGVSHVSKLLVDLFKSEVAEQMTTKTPGVLLVFIQVQC